MHLHPTEAEHQLLLLFLLLLGGVVLPGGEHEVFIIQLYSIWYQVFFQPPGRAHEVGGELLEHGPLLLLRAVLLRDVEREEDDRGHGEGELQLKRSFWL